MNLNPPFKSLQSTLDEIRQNKNLTSDQVLAMIAPLLERHRNDQNTLHFESPAGPLGPGRLVGFDLEARTVSIQLRGDGQILTFSFDSINDFGDATYENPQTMGQTLIAAFWEARTTRKYLERIVANSYARLSPEEVDSFGQISNVRETDVANFVPLLLSEAEVKKHLCDIIGNPFAQKDWGGEVCDIVCNIQFRRKAVMAAFVLKGKAYANRPLRISDLGKNGDQLVRMFSLPAEVFIVQSNGPIDGVNVVLHGQPVFADWRVTSKDCLKPFAVFTFWLLPS